MMKDKIVPIFTLIVILFFGSFVIHHLFEELGYNCDPLVETEMKVFDDAIKNIKRKGRKVTLLKNLHQCEPIVVGDLVALKVTQAPKPIIRIVRAGPGDKWAYRNGIIIVNGKALVNSQGTTYQIKSEILKLYAKNYPKIPAKTYLLMGDNPKGSLDSSRFGLIRDQDIIGKVAPQVIFWTKLMEKGRKPPE